MEPAAKREPGHHVNKINVRPAGDITLTQDDPAQVVLADQGDAVAVPVAYPGGHAALSGP
jgi:hypothetical protein